MRSCRRWLPSWGQLRWVNSQAPAAATRERVGSGVLLDDVLIPRRRRAHASGPADSACPLHPPLAWCCVRTTARPCWPLVLHACMHACRSCAHGAPRRGRQSASCCAACGLRGRCTCLAGASVGAGRRRVLVYSGGDARACFVLVCLTAGAAPSPQPAHRHAAARPVVVLVLLLMRLLSLCCRCCRRTAAAAAPPVLQTGWMLGPATIWTSAWSCLQWATARRSEVCV